MANSYFNAGEKQELTRVFTELADFIRKHKLAQIITVGPSAAPYGKHVVNAYQRRHGEPIKLVNLGRLGEKLGRMDSASGSSETLQCIKRKVNLARPALVFDEIALTGISLDAIRTAFKSLGLRHKTAVLANLDPTLLTVTPDFGYLDHQFKSPNLARKIGETWVSQRIHAGELKIFRKLHSDLREVAGSVQRKEQLQRERK